MSFGSVLKSLFRRTVESRGYWLRHRSVLPFGMDYQTDVARLSTLLDLPVRVFFDIGAHTGETALAVLRNFEGATVYSFEAHPTTFAELQKAVMGSRVKLVPLAISDRIGNATFFDYGHLATCNSLVGENQFAVRSGNPAHTLSVPCITLDKFCEDENIPQVDVLKIDTEGHDLSVLQGAAQTLQNRGVSFVYIEFNSMTPRKGSSGGALMPISTLLEDAGFEFVASYPECMLTEGKFFSTSNALFVRQARL
jgi:FkbM family methyltransferase